MNRFRICATLLTPVMACAVLSGCSLGGKSEFISLLEENVKQSGESTITFQDAFGQQWTKAAVVCPYESKESIHHRLGVTSSPGGAGGPTEIENLIFVRDDNGESSWIQFSRRKIDLCSSSITEADTALQSAATPRSFHFDANREAWIMHPLS